VGGLYARSLEFPDFSARYEAPGSNRRTSARGQDAGGLEYTWRRSARCWKPRRTRTRGRASPDDGDALALTFAQPVETAEVEEEDEEEEFGRYSGRVDAMTPPGRDPRPGEYSKRLVAALVEVARMVNGLNPDRHGAEMDGVSAPRGALSQ
jgi:hypothetical protein